MKTTIDRAGRIVVPKALRERMRLEAGGEVELVERDGVLEITVAPIAATIRSTADGPVAVAPAGTAELTDDIVRDTLDQIRR